MSNNQKATDLLFFLNKAITTKNNELALLLFALEATTKIHHSHHWQTKGKNYYEDHLLFERLYTETDAEIDGVGENTIVFSGRESTSYFLSLKIQKEFCNKITEVEKDLVENSLNAELMLIEVAKLAIEKAKSTNEYGLEQLIGNVLDKHNSHVYLLTSRLGR